MDRFQNRVEKIRNRNRVRYNAEKDIMKTYNIEEDLTRETTDEIEKALWDIKEALDIPTEEIELAVDSRRRIKGAQNGRSI